MRKFAKLYETEKYGQIVVFNDVCEVEDVPELKFYFIPEALDLCSSAIKFSADDNGFDLCDAAFESCDQEFAERIVASIVESLNLDGLAGEG